MQRTISNNSKVLTSLALMETSLLSQDYLSTFLPFIATLTLKKRYEYVDIGIVIQDFQSEFGINIPRAPMQSILSRAVSNGLISHSQEGKYIPIENEMQKISFLEKQTANNASIENIVNRFTAFVSEKHNIVVTRNEAADILTSFFDEYSPRTIASNTDDIEEGETISKKNLYLMGEFIQSIFVSDSRLFEIIRKLAMAHLVAVALTYDAPADVTRTQEFSDLTIYLDTPIILRLLGLQTKELEDSYEEMFASFAETIKPTYMIFQHTFDELLGIISDCANWIDNPAYNSQYANPALLRFIERKFSKTQIELYRTTLEDRLKGLNIIIDDKAYYNMVNRSAQIDVNKLKEKLTQSYLFNNPLYDVQRNASSLNYDIYSIENIVKLWGSKTSRTYSALGHIFLTNNATLAYVSRKFTSEYWWDSKNHKSPCITDYYLGTMVWLSAPIQRVESFSKLKLLSDCSAATTLSAEVMDKFLLELTRLEKDKGIKDGDFLLIRQYAFEKNYLQNITLNEETAFKDETIEQLLEDIKNDIQKPLIHTIQEKDEIIKKLNISDDEKEERIRQLEREKEKGLQNQAAQYAENERCANKTAGRIINIYAPILFALFGLFAIVLQVIPILQSWVGAIKIFAGIIAFLSVIFFGIMRSNLFGIEEKFRLRLLKYYQVKQYKGKI